MSNQEFKHIAFKCTYNNGREGRYAGFNGTCSNPIIKYNIEVKKHVWCSDKECDCTKFYKNGFHGEPPIEPCYESSMFSDKDVWKFSAGYKQSGVDRGDALHIRQTDIGKIVVLTTRFPDDEMNGIIKKNDTEGKRRIIGFYRIGKIKETKSKPTVLFSDSKFNIKLPLRVAKQTYFWDNHSNKTDIEHWGTGLFRYMEDYEVEKMLRNVFELLETTREIKVINQVSELIKLV